MALTRLAPPINLTEQLSLEPLELVEHERVELAVLLALVLHALELRCFVVVCTPNARELRFNLSHS